MNKRIFNILIIIYAAIAAGSCGLYKEYERDDMHFIDSLYRRMPVTCDSISTSSVSWKEFFTDPLLQEWISLGLEHNTDINIAEFRIREAEVSLKAAGWALFPGLTFNAQGSVPNSLNANLNMSWDADIFGSLRNSKRKAELALKQSEIHKHAVQTKLVATIANSYYTLLTLDEKLRISQRTLNTWEENIRTLEALKRAGKTNEAAVLQAKANRLSVEADVLTLQKEIFAMENSMCSLLGTVPMPINRSTLEEQKLPQTLSAGVPLELLEKRPDVRQAETVLAQSFYDVNIARASFYPNLTLSGTLGWTTGNGNVVLDPGSLISNVIASVTQPVFGKGKNKAKVEIAISKQQQALYEFRQTLLDAGVEVNNALSTWQTAKKRVEIDRKQIITLQAAVWNTQLLMKHGNTNYLEVLTAQKNLLQAELTETSDRFDEIQGVINLYYALGGGYTQQVQQ